MTNKQTELVLSSDMKYIDDYYRLRCDGNNFQWSWEHYVPDYNHTKQRFLEIVRSSERLLFYLIAGQTAGYIHLIPHANFVEIVWMAIEYPYCGMGHGRQMLAEALAYIRDELHHNMAVIFAQDKNLPLLRILEANGFYTPSEQEIGKYPLYCPIPNHPNSLLHCRL